MFTNFKDWNSDLSYSGAILFDAMYIASWFSYSKACFVPCHCKVVDHLASLTRFSESETWVGECPNCIEHFGNLDLV